MINRTSSTFITRSKFLISKVTTRNTHTKKKEEKQINTNRTYFNCKEVFIWYLVFIVDSSLVVVMQSVVCFPNMNEIFKRFVTRLFVRMPFFRDLQVCLPDFILIGFFINAQCFVQTLINFRNLFYLITKTSKLAMLSISVDNRRFNDSF